jgi:transcriptional regulator with XRE-family HTH domain
MRNSTESAIHPWAGFAKAARLKTGMNMAQLADRIEVERSTVGRWEKGENIPIRGAIVSRFAAVTGVDETEALQAAGIIPSQSPPTLPTLDDDELRVILESDASDQWKQTLIDYLYKRREEQRLERLEAIKLALGLR